MVFNKQSLRMIWPILFLLVLASNFALYRSSLGISILPANTNPVVLGSLIDLTIVAPVLFLAWQRKLSWKYLLTLMAGGLIVARFIIPMHYLTPFKTLTLMGFVVEAVFVLLELLLLLTLFKYLPEIIRSVKRSSLPHLFAFSNAVDQKVRKQPIIQVICSEMLMFYYAFCLWKKQPLPKENTFTLHQNSSLIAFQVMMIHAIVVETLGVHWWLHDKSLILSLLLLVINIYSVALFLGDIQAIRFNPLQVDHDRMYVSLGLMKRMEIKWTDIDEIIEDRPILEKKLMKNTIDFVARDFEKTYPDVIIKLKHPQEAVLFMGMKKKYEQVAIRVDDSEKFKEILKTKLQKSVD
ncbi:beta-carotene 15,15'-monooxygenase [Sporosarcina sp. P21c]|uniref:beta-carotene 15,15'-monooxygenase n=1 Tax=unclassified Sporosarcina TaxID=2647733 RepID=UPI000C16AC80|nr:MULTISPECIES: beta-carotene 15,15'-monooxygenase [unclassified Sporosarcina]PIC66122.1 beta-carotene 15,15'-monooxygenase [Sporosarcina sp. P16a]PIC88653.1 beta-carotene 15,15'-monooxygenase [Sporosarcina sp. P21c]PIC91724.1 beta-carotene 15,15'-monooxygenase [Sporosarcina sp. P25]